jgi:hypothetical protein
MCSVGFYSTTTYFSLTCSYLDESTGVDLISDALPFGHLWYGEPSAVINA